MRFSMFKYYEVQVAVHQLKVDVFANKISIPETAKESGLSKSACVYIAYASALRIALSALLRL